LKLSSMDRTGIVVNEMGEFSKVKLVRHTACGSCGACHLGDDQKDIHLIAKNAVDAHIGDMVEVSMPTNSVLTAAFIVYMIPLLAMFVGILVGQLTFPAAGKDVLSAVLGIVLMAITFVVIRLYDKRLLKSEKYTAHILSIVQKRQDDLFVPFG